MTASHSKLTITNRHRREVLPTRPPRLSRSARVWTPLVLAVLILAGCGERGDVGIFASIEREEKIEKSNLPENAHAGSMVYDSGTDTYYVAMGKLYSRGESDNDWDTVDHPSGYDEGHTLDIVSVDDGGGAKIYAAFFETDSTKSELFELTPGNDNWNKVWNPGKEISKLIAVDTDNDGINEELFAVTVDSNKEDYDLVYDPAVARNTVVSAVSKIFDGTHDGTDYFFVSSSQFWKGNSPSSLGKTGEPRHKGDFAGITYSSAESRLYVTTTRGRISYSDDGGGNWTTKNHDDDRRYTDPGYLDSAEFPNFLDGNGGLVVGLDTEDQSSGGYYEVTADLNSTSRPDGNNYNAADLSDAAIHGFYVDTDNNTLFALTYGDGLWRANYDDGEPEWSWE